MPIFRRYNVFLRIIVVISQVLAFFLMTSCALKDYEKQNNSFLFDSIKNQFKTLIVPKGITLPPQNQEYYVPYTKEDLNKKSHDIFPPL